MIMLVLGCTQSHVWAGRPPILEHAVYGCPSLLTVPNALAAGSQEGHLIAAGVPSCQ